MTMNVPKHIVAKAIEDQLVLLNDKDGTYYRLNETGAFVWQRLRDGASVDEAARALAERFETSLETAAADTRRLVEQLTADGLIA